MLNYLIKESFVVKKHVYWEKYTLQNVLLVAELKPFSKV